MNIRSFSQNPQFYGRRRGRKLSKSAQLSMKEGKDLFIKEENIPNIFNLQKYIVLEIGFGDGENLINSAKANPNFLYIGADPFLNTTAKCISKILQYNIKNIVIWPDDIRKILKFFPNNSISEIKLLFPDPWPKKKHRNRRLIQNEFIKTIYPIIKHKGTITISTDHDLLKKWVLEKFQNYTEFEWLVEGPNDWRLRPNDCYQTKYELKSINQQKNPCWFVFKKK